MSAHFPISELADILHGRSSSWRAMALLRAYFDESGIHGGARVTGIAGFIGTASAWEWIEERWLEELNRFPPELLSRFRGPQDAIRAFHAFDCEHGEGEFSDIIRPIREAFNIRLARVISDAPAEFSVRGMWSAVEVESWNQLVTPEFKRRYSTPYQLCAEHCFQQVAEWSRIYANGSDVALVFAETQALSDNISEIFSYYMKNKRWAHIKNFSTSSPIYCVPLQTADMLSYESYRDWDGRIDRAGLDRLKSRPVLNILERANQLNVGGCFGEEGLITAVKSYHRNEGLPNPYHGSDPSEQP